MTHALQLQINITLICQLVVLKGGEPKLSYQPVTPRPTGYGNATATYICRTKIPSHTYAKHQYSYELEYESTMIIYIPTYKVQAHCYHRE